MTHPNEELARRAYTAFGSGDMATMSELMADDVAWHTAGSSPIAGTFNGHDEVFGLFGRIAELSGGTFSLDVHDVLANDDHVVGLVNASGERNGTNFTGAAIHVMHVRDGKVSEFWSTAQDQAAFDAFWSD